MNKQFNEYREVQRKLKSEKSVEKKDARTLFTEYQNVAKMDKKSRLKYLLVEMIGAMRKKIQKKGVVKLDSSQYFTKTEIQDFLAQARPRKGKDYFTESEINEVVSTVQKHILENVPTKQEVANAIISFVQKTVAEIQKPLTEEQIVKLIKQYAQRGQMVAFQPRWGTIFGNIEDQEDLVAYIASHGGSGGAVSSVNAGDGTSVNQTTGNVTVTNTDKGSTAVASHVLEADPHPQYAEDGDIPTTLAELAEDSTHRVVTDTEKSTWNGKQDSIGYTPENSANKKTSLADNSDTFYPTQKAVKTAVDAKQDSLGFTPENSANKDQNGGYAGLDGDGKINPAQLPSLAIGETFTVASQVAMLALTAQKGDIAIRTDENKTYILADTDPSVLANWKQLLFPTDAVSSVFGRSGAVTAQSGDYNTSQVTESTDKKYVTDAEKTKLSSLSGTNTGDQDLSPYFHKTNDDLDDIIAGATNKHFTDTEKTKLSGIEAGAEVNNISDVNATDLTDGGATTLHKHSYNNLDDKPTIPDQLSDLSDDATHRLVTDTEKSTWNGKQDAIGFTPENVANKENATIDTSTTKYPTVNLLKTGLDSKQSTSEKNQANGYAGLDSGGKISSSQLPAIAITTTQVVASEVAMLALTAQTGDVAVRTDLNKSYILTTDDPTTLANWQELLTPTDVVQSVNGQTGTVSLDADDIDDTGTTKKFTNASDISKLSGIEASADVTDAGNVGSAIHGATAKTPPVDADTVPIIDTEASNVLKKITFANIKAFLKTYFDTLYQSTLGYTAENSANKENSTIDTSTTKYPTVNLLKTGLDGKVTANAGITGATKTKVTYDSKGLVTGGADATTADIADSSNKRYVTDAHLTTLGNTSGTNTGDQTDLPIVAVPGADVTASGMKITLTAGESLAFGDVCYVKSDGKLWKADANGSATYPALFLAIATISADASGSFLALGIARNDAWTWTVGGMIYLSTTAGGLTQTQPSATDEVIQVLGVATHADRMYFNPVVTYITHT